MWSSFVEGSGYISNHVFLGTYFRANHVPSWFSLIVVMAGVGLVGFSGSLIKDAVKESVGQYLAHPVLSSKAPEPIDKPEATAVVVGRFPLFL